MTEQQKRIETAIKELISTSDICKVKISLVERDNCGGKNLSDVFYRDEVVRVIIAEPIKKEHYDEIAGVLSDALDVLGDAEKEIIHDCSNPNWWKALCAKNRNERL